MASPLFTHPSPSMNKILPGLGVLILTTLTALADPALTIYNQNFAVVRDTIPLDLKAGVNDVTFADATAQLEPASVILRDPTGAVNLQILEQNYRNDPGVAALRERGQDHQFFREGVEQAGPHCAGENRSQRL
jgi:hypothetical protein